MNNEEAIKWLGNLINDIGQTRGMYLWPYAQVLQEIITILSDRNAAQQWISVKDRLPESAPNEYLVVNGGEVQLATFIDGMWITPHRVSSITHWMPLPEPPKEEEHEQ